MMFATDEVRWFFTGTMPESVTAWFGAQVCAAQVCTVPAQPPRTDFYLQLDGNDSLGIKLREGRIEVKQRENEGALVQLGERSVGRIESWRKWPFELANAEHSVTEQWMGVWKSRRWCLFEVADNGRIIPAATTTILEKGCACELTEVRLIHSSEQWWSLGFEAFGGSAAARRVRLLEAARWFLKQGESPPLSGESSYSYPKWLQIVTDKGRRLN